MYLPSKHVKMVHSRHIGLNFSLDIAMQIFVSYTPSKHDGRVLRYDQAN